MEIRGGRNSRWYVVVLFVVGSGLRPGAAQLLEPEFQVNTFTTSYQTQPAVAVVGSGNFVVVWQSYLQDGSGYGVFGRRYAAAGSPAGSEFQVNSHAMGYQGRSTVAADGLGNLVVAWESGGQDGSGGGVFGQRFDSAGSPLGSEFQVNSYTPGDQRNPAVATDGSGNFVVVWESDGQDSSRRGFVFNGVFGQRFDPTGSPLGSEFQVNTHTTSNQASPAVATDGAGNFVVVWESFEQDGSLEGVFGQRFDSVGSPLGGEFQVNSYRTSAQMVPAVAADGEGNFVVVWSSEGQDLSGFGVFGQQFDWGGSPLGSEFQVNTFTTSDQFWPVVAKNGAGNFVVAWGSKGQDGSGWGVFGQQFDSTGSRVGTEFQINSFTTLGQRIPAVAAVGLSKFVVAFDSRSQDGSSYGVFGRRMATALFSDGFETSDPCAWSAVVGSGGTC